MASEHFWIEISIGLNYWLLVAWMIRASIFEPSPNDPKIGGPRRNPSGAGLLKGSVDEQQGFFFGCFGVVASFLALFSFVHFCSFSDCTDNLQKTRDSLYFGGKTRVSRPLKAQPILSSQKSDDQRGGIAVPTRPPGNFLRTAGYLHGVEVELGSQKWSTLALKGTTDIRKWSLVVSINHLVSWVSNFEPCPAI